MGPPRHSSHAGSRGRIDAIRSTSLVTEIAYPAHRGALTAMYQAAWYWGAIVSAAVTLGTLHVSNSWSLRLSCLIPAVFPVIQFSGLCLVPESPRWHIAVGRSEQARATLIKYHADGDEGNDVVNVEFQDMSKAIQSELSEMSQSGWKSFFKTKGNLRRLTICILIGIMTEWAGSGRSPAVPSFFFSYKRNRNNIVLSRANPQLDWHYYPPASNSH